MTPTQRLAQQLRAELQPLGHKRPHCDAANKAMFEDREEAVRFCIMLNISGNHIPSRRGVWQPYRCGECGTYHIGRA